MELYFNRNYERNNKVNEASQEALQAKGVYFDHPIQITDSSVVSKMKSKGYDYIGLFCTKNQWKGRALDTFIFELDDFDKKWLSDAGIRPKAGEKIVRAATRNSLSSDTVFLVKINPVKGYVYFNDPDASDEGKVKFESRGEQVQYMRLDMKLAREFGVV